MTDRPTLRPMGLLEIVDQTFRLYRANFWLFLGIAAVVHVPLYLLSPAVSLWDRVSGFPSTTWWTLILSFVVAAALTKAVSDRYMGDRATIGTSYAYIGRRLAPLIGTILVMFLFVASGIVLLLVGLIVFAFWVSFVTEVFVIEDKRYFKAIWRSRFLIGDHVWEGVLVLGLVTGVIALVIQLPAYALDAALGSATGKLWVLRALVTGLSSSLALPISIVSSILLYYDSRVRKEGFDLEILARELGKGPTAPTGSVPLPPPEHPAADNRP